MIFTRKYSPRIGDFGQDGALSLRSVLELLEQIGFCHSEEVKDRLMAVQDVEIAWVLAEWTVKLLRPIHPGQELTFSTWVTGKPSASSTLREMEVLDEAGSPVIQALAKFALFNVETGRLTRITPELFGNYEPEPAAKNQFPGGRLREKGQYDDELLIPVRKGDIDFNGHVHNSVYLDYARELMKTPVGQIAWFRVGYKTPVKEGETLTLRHSQEGEEQLELFHEDGTLATIIQVGARNQ